MYVFQPDRQLLKDQVKELASYISGRVLDVGAGSVARYQSYFTYDEYIKMDVSSAENVDVVGSADSIPFENSSFDSVVCTQVFEHLSEPFTAAKEIGRVLKSGGYFLMTVPQTNELHEEPHDYYRYTKYGLKHMFESRGFETVFCLQRGGYHTLMMQLRVRYMIDNMELYKHPLLGRVISKIVAVLSKYAIWLDEKGSAANKKHTIGWTILYRKI
jgi:predicted SAM-dependent methyltransferase